MVSFAYGKSISIGTSTTKIAYSAEEIFPPIDKVFHMLIDNQGGVDVSITFSNQLDQNQALGQITKIIPYGEQVVFEYIKGDLVQYIKGIAAVATTVDFAIWEVELPQIIQSGAIDLKELEGILTRLIAYKEGISRGAAKQILEVGM